MYIHDGLHEPLCKDCLGWLCEGGGPYHPAAQERRARQLARWFPQLPRDVNFSIAAMLHHWSAP